MFRVSLGLASSHSPTHIGPVILSPLGYDCDLKQSLFRPRAPILFILLITDCAQV